MITASLIALSLLQSAIPAASVTARADLGSMVWELFGPAEPVLAQRSVAAEPTVIPLRQTVVYWADERGCVRPNGWAEFCRHYPTYTSGDVLLPADALSRTFRWGDPYMPPRGYSRFDRIWCASGWCYSGWPTAGLGYSAFTDYYGWAVQQQVAREFVETSVGLRTGLELEARGLIGGGSKGSGQAAGGSQGSGYAGGGSSGLGSAGGGYSGSASSAGSAGHGGGAGYGGGGGRGSSGGGKPGAELP